MSTRLSNSLNSLRRTESDKKELNELNNRFSNVLNIVKLETRQSENLQKSINDLKQQIFNGFIQKRQNYDHELHQTKLKLNNLCLDLANCAVRERHSRTLIDFFSNFDTTNENHTDFSHENLDKLSHFSVSQSSLLSSCSSQSIPISSSSSSSCCTDNESTDSALPPSPAVFSLETYLSNLNKNRSQLQSDYELKFRECQNLKENCENLNKQVHDLNNRLDTAKVDNLTLNESVKNLKKQIQFYKNVNQTPEYPKSNELWYENELDLVRREIRDEFQTTLEEDLEVYEKSLQEKLFSDLDDLQNEYDKECEKLDAESSSLLNELAELNENLSADFQEYQKLRQENTELNNRLIELSNKLFEFNSMDKPQQDKLILNYTVKNIGKDVESKRVEVKSLRQELGRVKAELCKTDVLKSGESQFFVRPYRSQIEYSKSNLFSYLIIKFDLIYNSIKSNNKNASILNSLKFYDTVDGHSITIENQHKILDIDLSEWTIRREIFSTVTLKDPDQVIEYKLPQFFKLKRRKKVSFVCANCDKDDDEFSSNGSLNSFPKLTHLKCACCACKLMVKRSGDVDIMEVEQVANWGCGLLTVTKLISNKNVIKMANFKFLKQIWVNKCLDGDDYEEELR